MWLFFFLGERRRGDSRQETILMTDPVVTLQSNKVPVVQPSHAVHPLTPLITYSDEHFSPGSHPSHIPSDVNSKQGKCFRLPRPLSPVKRPCLWALVPFQVCRCLCPVWVKNALEDVHSWLAIRQKSVKICWCFNFSQKKHKPTKNNNKKQNRRKVQYRCVTDLKKSVLTHNTSQ